MYPEKTALEAQLDSFFLFFHATLNEISPHWLYLASAPFALAGFIVGLAKKLRPPRILAALALLVAIIGAVLEFTHVFTNAIDTAGVFWQPVAFVLVLVLLGPVLLSLAAFIAALVMPSKNPRALERVARRADSMGVSEADILVQSEGTNPLAIAAFISALLGTAIIPVILGHVALAQIKRTNERGRGLALVGLILGYVSLVALATILVVVSLHVAALGVTR